MASAEYAAQLARAEASSEKLFHKLPQLGANPYVFFYQVHEGRSQVTTIVRMVFYGLLACYVYRPSALSSRRTQGDA